MGRGARGKCFFIGVFLTSYLGVAQAADRLDKTDTQAIEKWCEPKVIDTTDIVFEEDAVGCGGYYFGRQGLEEPNQVYEKVLTFFKRAIDIQPSNYKTYAIVIWLHYSRWTLYKERPAQFPHYKNQLKVAYAWSDLAENRFAKRAVALKAIGDELRGAAYFHDEAAFDRVERLYTKAEALSYSPKFRLRCRLSMAHVYRKMSHIEDAIQAYERVLELDPSNYFGKRYLRELNDGLVKL